LGWQNGVAQDDDVRVTYYNHRRLHSTLGFIRPMRFEKNWVAAQLKKTAQ
jgi:transposase InsO family protein